MRDVKIRAGQGSRYRYTLGQQAELAVADFLHANGFKVLARNLRLGSLELDLVAKKGPLVAVIEVRTRGPGSFERGLASISYRKQWNIIRAAERLWSRRLARNREIERLRIDVASVTFAKDGTFVEYIPGAIVLSPRR